MKYIVYAAADQTACFLGRDKWVFKGSEARLFGTKDSAQNLTCPNSWVRRIPNHKLKDFLEEDWAW